MAFDPLGLQDAMDPEAVETRLLNDHKRKVPAGARLCLVLKLGKACQQSCDIAAAYRMFRLLFPTARRQRRDQPGRFTETVCSRGEGGSPSP